MSFLGVSEDQPCVSSDGEGQFCIIFYGELLCSSEDYVKSNLSKSMPWIGLYVATASLACLISVLFDVFGKVPPYLLFGLIPLLPPVLCLPPHSLLPARGKVPVVRPHSGFSNQLSEFRNALLISLILNRTLIVPPVLDHHAVALGSCPKFRVSIPAAIRFAAWEHVIHLIRTRM